LEDRGLSEPRFSEPSSSACCTSGAIKRSSLDRDRRHIGQRELELLRIFRMQVWQYM
jgi:hypothetical protein